jgi:ComF family protein
LAIYSACLYEELAKALIWQLKFNHVRSAAREAAVLMAACPPTKEFDWLVPVPTAPSRIRQRGYDQTLLLARAVSRLTGVPVLPALARQGSSRQVGATRRERQQQLADAFWLRLPKAVPDARLLLVDDVITTGSTLEATARLLLAGGAAEVSALTFAQAE